MSVNQDYAYPSGHQQRSVAVDGAVKQTLEITRPRLIFIAAFFAFAYLMLAFRLLDLGTAASAEDAISRRAVPPLPELKLSRGAILDRNGVLIATNLATASLYADGRQIIDAEEAAFKLSEIFPSLDYKDLVKKLSSKKSFMWVKRKLTPKEQQMVNDLGIPGLHFQREEKRIYPHGNIVSHITGMVGVDGHGLSGLEKSFDKLLLSEQGIKDSLELSIDIRVQSILHEELSNAMKNFNALGAAGVIMNANTGEVLAMASLPDYNPNNPSKIDAEATFNRATFGVYEMGSTFKAFPIAQGLDEKIIKLNDSYDAREPIQFARHTIRDFHPENRWLTVPEIFVHSSNIGTARIAMDIGEQRQKNFLKKLGLLDSLEFELPEKGTPLYPDKWRKINAMTIAYGHGLAVTPMHLVRATAAMVNGGYLLKPTIIRQGSADAIEKTQVISPKTSAIMRKLYRMVVAEGTGSKASATGYMVGGKTGTAEKLENGRYKRNARLSSFVGAFPTDKPEYVMFVMLDEPKGNASTFGYATGGFTAAPVVGSVVSRIAPMLGIMPEFPEQKTAEATTQQEKSREPSLATN